jgi:hypothetical protein
MGGLLLVVAVAAEVDSERAELPAGRDIGPWRKAGREGVGQPSLDEEQSAEQGEDCDRGRRVRSADAAAPGAGDGWRAMLRAGESLTSTAPSLPILAEVYPARFGIAARAGGKTLPTRTAYRGGAARRSRTRQEPPRIQGLGRVALPARSLGRARGTARPVTNDDRRRRRPATAALPCPPPSRSTAISPLLSQPLAHLLLRTNYTAPHARTLFQAPPAATPW